MSPIFVLSVLLVTAAVGEEVRAKKNDDTVLNNLSNTDLKLAFVIFRHGDRTPDHEELILFPSKEKLKDNLFFPYGMKQLTNKGKQRGYAVGKYLRKRYDGLINSLYLNEELYVRTTSYDRTKMTALTALAGLYPPPTAQRWKSDLEWQPIPYYTAEYEDDPLMYWYTCDLYRKIRYSVYQLPEVVKMMKPYQQLISYLRNVTDSDFNTPEDVFYFDNLLQTLSNVGVSPPKWIVDELPQIKEVTKIEYASQFYTPELIKMASGVLMDEFLNLTSNYMSGYTEQPKLRLYSAHENNVAGLMAAAKVFNPHQPRYGSTFSLELREGGADTSISGQYFVAAVYSKYGGAAAEVIPVTGCGGNLLCPYDEFVSLVKENVMTKKEYYNTCKSVSKS